MYQSATHWRPSGFREGIWRRMTLSRISRTFSESELASSYARFADIWLAPTSVAWIPCVIRTTVFPSFKSCSSSPSPEIRLGSASFIWISCSSSRRAWFSGLVIVSITKGFPTEVGPSVSTTTLGLVSASLSKYDVRSPQSASMRSLPISKPKCCRGVGTPWAAAEGERMRTAINAAWSRRIMRCSSNAWNAKEASRRRHGVEHGAGERRPSRPPPAGWPVDGTAVTRQRQRMFTRLRPWMWVRSARAT